MKKQLEFKIGAYSTEALSEISAKVPRIKGRLTFKALWDTRLALIPMLHKIKHLDHPVEGVEGMRTWTALVSTRPWQVPERVEEVFHVPRWAITDTNQQTEKRKWTAKKG